MVFYDIVVIATLMMVIVFMVLLFLYLCIRAFSFFMGWLGNVKK